ncbi:MAG: hypothetical protein HC814_00510 [Rhodobacteraceae bacterium]|nr:hypothetical protein [Paracoccaceae bacterium]
MAAKLRDQLMALPHAFPHAVVVKTHVLFDERASERLRLMHLLEVSAAEQLGQLANVDRIVLIAVLGDQRVAPRLANDQPIDVRPQICATASPQADLPRRSARAGRRTESIRRHERRNRRVAPLATNFPPGMRNRRHLTELAMHVQSDKMFLHSRGSCVESFGTSNTPKVIPPAAPASYIFTAGLSGSVVVRHRNKHGWTSHPWHTEFDDPSFSTGCKNIRRPEALTRPWRTWL